MDRRSFIGHATVSLLVPSALVPGAPAPVLAAGGGGERQICDYLVFDDRFPRARRLALEWAHATVMAPVQADITAIWNATLRAAVLETPLTIRGVTTESFFFCLHVMAAEQARVDAHATRVDSNLYLWMLRTENQFKRRELSWPSSFLPA